MRISDWSSDVCSSDLGVRAIVGTRLDLADGTALLLYPTDKAAYGRMCRLLSAGKARAGKGACHLDWGDVEEWNEGLLALLLQIGRAHVLTPVTNAHLVCRLLLEKKNKTIQVTLMIITRHHKSY